MKFLRVKIILNSVWATWQRLHKGIIDIILLCNILLVWHIFFIHNLYQICKNDVFFLWNISEIGNVSRVSIQLEKHEWKFGRTRNLPQNFHKCFYNVWGNGVGMFSISFIKQLVEN